MSSIIEKFGSLVGRKVTEKPGLARGLLVTAYKGKRIQLKHFPDKRLSPARDYMAVESMNAIINSLTHPEKAALVSIFMPCELLHAYGVYPMLAEALSSYVNGAIAEKGFIEYAEGQGIAETYCSYHKILLGGILSGVIPKPRFIVNSSLLCDANNLTFRMAAEHYGIPHHYIDVPMDISEYAVDYVAEQLRELSRFLADIMGREADISALRESVACAGRTMNILRECQSLKRDRFLQNDLTSELYEVFATHVLLGTPQMERYAAMLRDDIRASGRTQGVRILWMHTIPYYQSDLRKLLNFNPKAQVISCDMNLDCTCEADPEHPYESMARRLVTNSFNGTSDNRIRRALEMCREQDIDGVIYFCHWGCKQTAGAAGNVRRALESEGYPVLILDGDGCDRGNASNGQMATRVEAFLEMLGKKI